MLACFLMVRRVARCSLMPAGLVRRVAQCFLDVKRDEYLSSRTKEEGGISLNEEEGEQPLGARLISNGWGGIGFLWHWLEWHWVYRSTFFC